MQTKSSNRLLHYSNPFSQRQPLSFLGAISFGILNTFLYITLIISFLIGTLLGFIVRTEKSILFFLLPSFYYSCIIIFVK